MDENFEEQLTGMMRYRSEPGAAPFTVNDVLAGVRHRSRTRALGVAGSALAVVAVGVGAVSLAGAGASRAGAVTTAGGGPVAPLVVTPVPAVTSTAPTSPAAPTTAGSPTRTPIVSPVENVVSGQKITVVEGYQVWVTSHEKCEAESAAFMGAPASSGGVSDCKNVTGPNMAWDGKHDWLGVQGTGTKTRQVFSGTFQGATIPSLIEVEHGGKHYTATILETAGMTQNHWVAFYVTYPLDTTTVNGPRSYTITAYDANGKALAQVPPANLGS